MISKHGKDSTHHCWPEGRMESGPDWQPAGEHRPRAPSARKLSSSNPSELGVDFSQPGLTP